MACVASRPQAGYGVCLRVLNEVCLCVCFCWYIFICKLCGLVRLFINDWLFF